jgi:hypothetical protein
VWIETFLPLNGLSAPRALSSSAYPVGTGGIAAAGEAEGAALAEAEASAEAAALGGGATLAATEAAGLGDELLLQALTSKMATTASAGVVRSLLPMNSPPNELATTVA